jgi:hypothetical protein
MHAPGERRGVPTRRRALQGVCGAVAALAGCFRAADARVRVLNDTDATVTVTTTIRDLDADRRVVDETFDLPPASEVDDIDERSRKFTEEIEDDTRYEVAVAVAGGPTGTEEYDADRGRLWATVEDGEVTFQNVVD